MKNFSARVAGASAGLMRSLLAAAFVGGLSGCASFSVDGGFGKVAELTRERIGQGVASQRSAAEREAARESVAVLLAQPLTADTAVQVALLNNKDLQADLAGLGIAEADLVRAGRLPNPSLRFGRTRGAGIVEVDRAVLFDVIAVLTMPIQLRAERQRFEAVQFEAASRAVGVAAEARRAFFSAVAAQDLVNYFAEVADAADASNDLARRMVAAGNFNELAQMREQAFHADATLQLARARHRAVAERERLTRLLGLGVDRSTFVLAARLPDLPASPAEALDAEQIAIDKRLDVWAAKRSTEATAKALGLTQATRFVNVLEAGFANKSQTGEGSRDGYQIELELPLFDFGSARAARAEAVYLQAVDRTAAVANDARSEVRESYSAYRTAYDIAKRYRDEVVPLRKRIADANLLRYNGMLISVFDLLADAREQVASVAAYVEALRDYWVAETDLQTAMTGRSPATIRPAAGPSL